MPRQLADETLGFLAVIERVAVGVGEVLGDLGDDLDAAGRAGRRARRAGAVERARPLTPRVRHVSSPAMRLIASDEVLPAAALRGEDLAPDRRQPVVAAAALAGLLDPLPLDPAALLEAVEERVERGDVVAQRAAGARLDQLADLVAVPGRASTSERTSSSALPFFSSRSPARIVCAIVDMLRIDIS